MVLVELEDDGEVSFRRIILRGKARQVYAASTERARVVLSNDADAINRRCATGTTMMRELGRLLVDGELEPTGGCDDERSSG